MSIAHAVSNAADRLDRGARVPELVTQAADEDIDNVLNTVSHTVTVDDQPIELTSREREILALFLANPGRVFTRERILNKIWGSQADHLTNVNNAASGYVKALQHLMYGEGAYQILGPGRHRLCRLGRRRGLPWHPGRNAGRIARRLRRCLC